MTIFPIAANWSCYSLRSMPDSGLILLVYGASRPIILKQIHSSFYLDDLFTDLAFD